MRWIDWMINQGVKTANEQEARRRKLAEEAAEAELKLWMQRKEDERKKGEKLMKDIRIGQLMGIPVVIVILIILVKSC